MNLDTITQQFLAAGVGYNTAIQPYALDLFWGLFFIEFIITAIQYLAEGQLDPWHYGSRLFRHTMTAGFIYLMITRGFTWMFFVITSFQEIGQTLTGLPNISPQGILLTGLTMGQQILNMPGTSGIISNLELLIVEAVCVLLIVGAFALVAIEIMLLFCRAYITIGAGVIVLGFGANRFTSAAADGYFTNVIRLGVKLLFYYLVLGIGMQIVVQWQAAIAAVCAPIPTTVGLLGSYYVPPTAIATAVCSGSLSISDMLSYAVYSAVFAAIAVAVPMMASELVGGALGLALMHAFEGAYILSKVTSPVRGAASTIAGAASSAVSSATNNKSNNTDSPGVQAAMASAASKANSSGAQQQPPPGATSPFNGQQPGYNVRNGNAVTASPGAAQNSGPGQLTYQPGKPGQHTKDIAVDVTDIQNRNGNGEDNDPA